MISSSCTVLGTTLGVSSLPGLRFGIDNARLLPLTSEPKGKVATAPRILTNRITITFPARTDAATHTVFPQVIRTLPALATCCAYLFWQLTCCHGVNPLQITI
jgi:hypothetical protein